jgi:hypothetical protein
MKSLKMYLKVEHYCEVNKDINLRNANSTYNPCTLQKRDQIMQQRSRNMVIMQNDH